MIEGVGLIKIAMRFFEYTIFIRDMQYLSKKQSSVVNYFYDDDFFLFLTRSSLCRSLIAILISFRFSILRLNTPLINNLLYLLLPTHEMAQRNTLIWLMRLLKETGTTDIGVDTDLLKLSTISGIRCTAIDSSIHNTA